jgi:hypothetical protein
MSDADKPVGLDKPKKAHLDDADLRAIARRLFIAVDMIRVADADYDVAVNVLRGVYDRGRHRGYHEAKGE